MKKNIKVAKMKNNQSVNKRVVIEKKEDDISDLMSKTVYNNYARSMNEINIKRGKAGLNQIPVRSLEEWRGED